MVLLTDGKMCEKMTAHSKGLSHYALSILIFNEKGEMLLQKRAKDKYHSGGLWSNACCTHPLFTDIKQIQEEAFIRLKYEMGIDCALDFVFSISYRVRCDSLIENEVNYVFVGKANSEPVINQKEVSDYKWSCPTCIDEDRNRFPDEYTPWFHLLFDRWKEICKNNTEESMP
jgi:isopentenyl-diphosphate delta-isomerase